MKHYRQTGSAVGAQHAAPHLSTIASLLDSQHFQRRLAETIAWCSSQILEANPPETEEFRNRLQLAEKGRALYNRANLLEKSNRVHRWLVDHLRFQPHENLEELRQHGLALMRKGDVTSILPLNHQLRTPALEPPPFGSPQENRVEIVEALAAKRAAMLRERDAYPQSTSGDLAGGRLLVYEPDDNVEDGASQHQSKGYLDGKDAPPWDTWLFYENRSLISWVAPSLLHLVRKGVAVNCVDCIHWIEDNNLRGHSGPKG